MNIELVAKIDNDSLDNGIFLYLFLDLMFQDSSVELFVDRFANNKVLPSPKPYFISHEWQKLLICTLSPGQDCVIEINIYPNRYSRDEWITSQSKTRAYEDEYWARLNWIWFRRWRVSNWHQI